MPHNSRLGRGLLDRLHRLRGSRLHRFRGRLHRLHWLRGLLLTRFLFLHFSLSSFFHLGLSANTIVMLQCPPLRLTRLPRASRSSKARLLSPRVETSMKSMACPECWW